MLVRELGSIKMLFIEELMKERTRVNIFRNLRDYGFWDLDECSIQPKTFGPASYTDNEMEIRVTVARQREVIFVLENQNFGNIKGNLRSKMKRYTMGGWYE